MLKSLSIRVYIMDVDTSWLKLNYFVITHKDDLKKWWVIILIAIDVFIVVFVVTNLILFILGMLTQNNLMIAMAQSPINYKNIRVQNTPIEVSIVDTSVLPAGNGKYDFIAQVKNLNKNWLAETITYQYSITGESTEEYTDFILPNSEKFLTALGIKSDTAGSTSATLEIIDVKWKRIDDTSQIDSSIFSFNDINYTTTVSNSGQVVHAVRGTAVNDTYIKYWDTKFVVVLYSGDKVTGIKYIYFNQFDSREEKNLYAQWDSVLLPVTNVLVSPDFDFLAGSN